MPVEWFKFVNRFVDFYIFGVILANSTETLCPNQIIVISRITALA